MFRRACRKGMHPVASFEGMDSKSELMVAWSDCDRVHVHRETFGDDPVEISETPLRVELPGRFCFRGTHPDYAVDCSVAGGGVKASFTCGAGWPIWWARGGRLLQYAGQHSTVKAVLAAGGADLRLDGFGVVEHVAGAAAPVDITRVVPFGFHWDVLVFDRQVTPFDSAAGLSIIAGGRTLVALRAAAMIPGTAAEAMRGLKVEYSDLRVECVNGREIAVPARWTGEMVSARGLFRYEARAVTPVAPLVPGGGFLGFDFEGEWRGKDGSRALLTGTGFNEYGDFDGSLKNAGGG